MLLQLGVTGLKFYHFPMTFVNKNGELIVDSSCVKAAFERQPFGSDTCAIHSRLVSCDQSKHEGLVIGVSLFFLVVVTCGSGLNNLLQPKKSSEEAAAKLQMALEAAAKESNQMLYQHPDKQQKRMESP